MEESRRKRPAAMVAVMVAMVAAMVVAMVATVEEAAAARTGKEMRMVWYMHDVVRGPRPTAVQVAGPGPGNATSASPAGAVLGRTFVMDDPLTAGPAAGSRHVGRAQGVYVAASPSGPAPDLFLAFTAVLSWPPALNGSTLAVQGSDRVALPARDVAVVGGTGALRRAAGHVTISTVSTSLAVNAVLRLDVRIVLPAD